MNILMVTLLYFICIKGDIMLRYITKWYVIMATSLLVVRYANAYNN